MFLFDIRSHVMIFGMSEGAIEIERIWRKADAVCFDSERMVREECLSAAGWRKSLYFRVATFPGQGYGRIDSIRVALAERLNMCNQLKNRLVS